MRSERQAAALDGLELVPSVRGTATGGATAEE